MPHKKNKIAKPSHTPVYDLEKKTWDGQDIYRKEATENPWEVRAIEEELKKKRPRKATHKKHTKGH